MKLQYYAGLWLAAILFCACGTRKAAQPQALQPAASELVNSLTQIQLPPEEKQIPSGGSEKTPQQNTQPQLPVAEGWEAELRAALDSLCNNDSLAQTSQMGIYIHDLTQNTPLYARNAHHRMRPASCQKVITAVAALHYLGAQHRLRTTLHMTGQISGTVLKGNLYVVGGMDPTVTAAEVDALVRSVAMAGIRRIQGKVCKDLGMTDGEPYGWGWCWDDDYGPLS
ncbi:MAG: D-alanyl-D-alanine carboxypeptidase, partial [Bacteroidaceae bacterium]|nr:D-alanyl-D-alanine carboxypeptidase [Bacteroidaceae bacterium]